VKIGTENENRLGVTNCQLGLNMICGPRVWERQSKFRIRVGPINLDTFRLLLPCGNGFRPFTELARLFAGTEYDLDVQLVLKAPQVPRLQLRSDGAKEGAHLGWSSWLKTGSSQRTLRIRCSHVRCDLGMENGSASGAAIVAAA